MNVNSIKRLKAELQNAEAIVIGAGAGLSAAAGYTYSGKRFTDNFADFCGKYGITDMYSGGFYPYPTPEEYWAYWSRYIFINRYIDPPKPVYKDLYSLVADKNYFVVTTNVDHCFQKAGFDKSRLFYTQGDYGLFQCSEPCRNATYDNEQAVRRMAAEQKEMKVSSELIPQCPICGKPMIPNLRADGKFVQDKGWEAACRCYERFLSDCENKCVLFFELGVGGNTPVIIKFPFWRMTARNARATYVCVNYGEAYAPQDIKSRSICLNRDIAEVMNALKSDDIKR